MPRTRRKTDRARALERLSKAISEAVGAMDPIKRGFVESEYESYRWNSNRLDDLEEALSRPQAPEDRKDLRTERHQLVSESGQLFSHLMRQLKDAGDKAEEDPLADFIGGR